MNRKPRIAAGRKATIRFTAKRREAGSVVTLVSACPSRARYSHTTARIAANWMAISNTLALSSLNPSRSPARIRCPVLDTGRNSVRPSTMPRMSACSRMRESVMAMIGVGMRRTGLARRAIIRGDVTSLRGASGGCGKSPARAHGHAVAALLFRLIEARVGGGDQRVQRGMLRILLGDAEARRHGRDSAVLLIWNALGR